jgi:hypothetical protein
VGILRRVFRGKFVAALQRRFQPRQPIFPRSFTLVTVTMRTLFQILPTSVAPRLLRLPEMMGKRKNRDRLPPPPYLAVPAAIPSSRVRVKGFLPHSNWSKSKNRVGPIALAQLASEQL